MSQKYNGTIDGMCINTIRTLAIDAIEAAKSGHPGAPMGLAPAAYVLWTRFLKHHPRKPDWPDRDRFVLSGGHASMMLYSLLYLCGYDLSLDDIKKFRQWGSKTPGHPSLGIHRVWKPQPAPWDRDLPMRWAWPWPSGIWRRNLTGTAMRSLVIIPM